ncbi:MAG: hypothetical protein Q8Q88_05665 [Phenylobacterium sp.]|uniref:hypothetical protein n=1 Tax=Phenylobacterium sp. TaxID=1871053 RepID=UPI0027329E87|nr:hypothetical protein [Phenylobacterium sp.]MDP3746523.1 hypothetical protein [Phenylobacterium sp.]
MPQDPRSNSPTPQQAARAREPAGGVGQDAQRDPNQVDSETRVFEAGPANQDLFELEEELLAERPSKAPADREHGPKTKGRSKQIVSGKPYG